MAKKFKGKTAVGFSAEGNSLHMVKVGMEKKRFHVLETYHFVLKKSLDTQESGPEEEEISVPLESEEGSLDLTEHSSDEEMAMMGLEAEDKTSQDDSGVFVEILRIMKESRTRMATTVAEPQIFYHVLDSDFDLKGRGAMKRVLAELSALKDEYFALSEDMIALVPLTEDRNLVVAREQQLPVIERMEEVKSFVNNRLPEIAFIESLELSLVNLVLKSRGEEDEEKITLILHVGMDASRFIFMKGNRLHHISPVIADGANSPNISATLGSRLMFELDTLNLQSVDEVLLSGEACNVGVQEFLEEKLSEEIRVLPVTSAGMVNTGALDETAEEMAPYGAALGAAIHALMPKDGDLIDIDLTPKRIKEGQNKLLLGPPGWVMLFLIPIIGLSMAYYISQQIAEMYHLKRIVYPMRAQIYRYDDVEAEIAAAQQELASFERSFSVIDSLGTDTDTWSRFLSRVSRINRNIGNFWLLDVKAEGDNRVHMSGYSLYRNSVPRFVEALGNAELKRVEVQDIREKTVYRFEILASLTAEEE